MIAPKNRTVASAVGHRQIDCSGSPVSVVRIDPHQAYIGVPEHLRRYIDESDSEAWRQIRARIDQIYYALDRSLTELEEATTFSAQVRAGVAKGKKVLFKPNLVHPGNIDPTTRGAGSGNTACTDWTFAAALMRWFHDKLDVSYHQMCVGEAASAMVSISHLYSLHYGRGRRITTEAVIEGRSGEFYGGWGFYFVRKYLAETHPPAHFDDPMQGHDDSVTGTYIPPGRATDKLMVYDLNRTFDDDSKPRDVPVPEGANYQTITLHKVVTGGDPDNPDDILDYPGCVIVNMPKLKVHTHTAITCAVKNLGIGLYPLQAADIVGPKGQAWKYGVPHNETPALKWRIPHEVWQLVVDPLTERPVKDEQGNYQFRRTAGINATMSDIIKAVEACGTAFIHVVDAIECTNIDHTGTPMAVKVPEGLIFAGLDCVALDLLCARYLVKSVPMADAQKLKEERNFPDDFLQEVPIPRFDGQNMVTQRGYDSILHREPGFEYAEARGIGRREYYVVGWDLTASAPLASLNGHLGRIDDGNFVEIYKGATYFSVAKFLWDMQATVMGYLRSIDEMAGTSYRSGILKVYDENGDGVIDLDERGRQPTYQTLGRSWSIRGRERYGFLHAPFFATATGAKNRRASWNPDGIETPRSVQVSGFTFMAMQLSRSPQERPDPFVPGLTYGIGRWPSPQLVEHITILTAMYGPEYPERVGPLSLYGLACSYADKALNGATYTGSKGIDSDPQAADRYVSAVMNGAKPLDFILCVPRGWGNVGGRQLPNVEETDDPAKVFTASFAGGKETW